MNVIALTAEDAQDLVEFTNEEGALRQKLLALALGLTKVVVAEPAKPEGVLTPFWERALAGYRFVLKTQEGTFMATEPQAPVVLLTAKMAQQVLKQNEFNARDGFGQLFAADSEFADALRAIASSQTKVVVAGSVQEDEERQLRNELADLRWCIKALAKAVAVLRPASPPPPPTAKADVAQEPDGWRYRDTRIDWKPHEGWETIWKTEKPFIAWTNHVIEPVYLSPPTPSRDALVEAQEPKYTTRDGKIVNRASGEAIPDDEPVFIFRARDVHARAALIAYRAELPPGPHRDAVSRRIADFCSFAYARPGRMKEPDTAALSATTEGQKP